MPFHRGILAGNFFSTGSVGQGVKWFNQSGMVINEDKAEYMSFNSSEKRLIFLNTHAGMTVSQYIEYVYLGCIITSDGKLSSSVKKHESTRGKSMNKLVRFLDKNGYAPFSVKKTVLGACFYTSLLYGCESSRCQIPKKQ